MKNKSWYLQIKYYKQLILMHSRKGKSILKYLIEAVATKNDVPFMNRGQQ